MINDNDAQNQRQISKWEGPFIIETVYSNGAYRLMTSDGDLLMMPINGKFLKKYYP